MLQLKGKPVAENVYSHIKEQLKSWTQKPHLAVILVGEDPASQVYVSHKQKACESLGFESQLVKLSDKTTEAELTQKINELNADNTIDAILL